MIVSPSLAGMDQAVSPAIESLSTRSTTTAAQEHQLDGVNVVNPAGFATMLINAMGSRNIGKTNKAAPTPTTDSSSLGTFSIAPEMKAATPAVEPPSNNAADELNLPDPCKAQLCSPNQQADGTQKCPIAPADLTAETDGGGHGAAQQGELCAQGGNGAKLDQTADYHEDSLQTTADPPTLPTEVAPALARNLTLTDKGIGKESAAAAMDVSGTSLSPPIDALHQAGMYPPSGESTLAGTAFAAAGQTAGVEADWTGLQGHERPATVQLQLESPDLGSVRVHICASGQSISARVVVQDESTRQFLENHAGWLRDKLADNGITLTKLVITQDGSGSSEQGQKPPFEQPAGQLLPQIGSVPAAAGVPGAANGQTAVIDVIA